MGASEWPSIASKRSVAIGEGARLPRPTPRSNPRLAPAAARGGSTDQLTPTQTDQNRSATPSLEGGRFDGVLRSGRGMTVQRIG